MAVIKKKSSKSKDQAAEMTKAAAKEKKHIDLENKPCWDYVCSTGSLTCDLAISGGRLVYGGIPSGIIVVVYGPSGCIEENAHISYTIVSKDGKRQNHKGSTIKVLYERFNGLERKGKGSYQRPETIGSTFFSSSVNDLNQIVLNQIEAVVYSGKKKCYKVTCENGDSLIATKKHGFSTETGYKNLGKIKLGDLLYLKQGAKRSSASIERRKVKNRAEVCVKYHPAKRIKTVNGIQYCRIPYANFVYEASKNKMSENDYRMALNTWKKSSINKLWTVPKTHLLHHVDKDFNNNEISNLALLTGAEHSRLHFANANNRKPIVSLSKVISIEYVGSRDTYDISCRSPLNNFIANKFVVHNSGKTAILAEMVGNVQASGGGAEILDPEARIDAEYAQIYGMSLAGGKHYHRPDTIKEMYTDWVHRWDKLAHPEGYMSLIAADSLTALSTDLEMENEDGDKMGMKRAKEFSAHMRKSARIISNTGRLLLCTSQIRSSGSSYGSGEVIPGGNALIFYPSLICRTQSVEKIEKEKSIPRKVTDAKGNVKEVMFKAQKVTGIRCEMYVTKSSVDDPFRKCEFFITFGYGMDDIRSNLHYLKETMKTTTYDCIKKNYVALDDAVSYIENSCLEQELRDRVVEVWQSVEAHFKKERKAKVRF